MKVKNLIGVILLVVVLLAACAPAATEEPVQPTEEPVVTEEPTEAPTEPPMEPVELRFTYYADGVEAEVIQPLLDAFMVEYPYITVILDVVPYKTIDEQLPAQVESGEGPDLARGAPLSYSPRYQDKLY